jgi:hypothetical protein
MTMHAAVYLAVAVAPMVWAWVWCVVSFGRSSRVAGVVAREVTAAARESAEWAERCAQALRAVETVLAGEEAAQ